MVPTSVLFKEKKMTYILVLRNPNSRGIVIIQDDDEITQFKTREQAEQCAANQPLCQAWGYQVVGVD
jgi:hypothetical protein